MLKDPNQLPEQTQELSRMGSHTRESDVCGENYAEFSNGYEQRLRHEGAAVGESAKSDSHLDGFMKTLAECDGAFQKAFLARDRRHDLHFGAGVACFYKTAEKSPGYLENLFSTIDVTIAPNASSSEHAIIAALIRFLASEQAVGGNASVRVSRLTKTVLGIILFCEALHAPVHLGNIAQVIDIALSHSRTFFKAQVDIRDNLRAEMASDSAPNEEGQDAVEVAADVTDASYLASAEPPVLSSPPDALDKTAELDAATLMGSPVANVATRVRPRRIGVIQNTDRLPDDAVVLIGHIDGDTVSIFGPITTPLADDLLRSLEDAARSAA
jgi:hypothetical protein